MKTVRLKNADVDRRSLRILLVDDEEKARKTTTAYLRERGHKVTWTSTGASALRLLGRDEYDLVLLDATLKGADGIKLLAEVQETQRELAVVIIAGSENESIILRALRMGAADFLASPIKPFELDTVIEKASRIREMRQHQRRLQETIKGIQASAYKWRSEKRLVGISPAMEALRTQIRTAVEANCETILVSGETGTGKEVVAREIHLIGNKAGAPFIPVSCPAMPESLLDGELFGHVKGSFTGADSDRAGYFELAEGGTLFLDEIADLSESAQSKLLRALDTRRIRRIGGSREIDVNVLVIAATNARLESLVDAGKFRRDLYYRLNVYAIDIPPLRDRREDIIPLAEHFLQTYVVGRGIRIQGFTRDAKSLLTLYDYPGNARELRYVVERAAILCQSGKIDGNHLQLPAPAESVSNVSRKPEQSNEREVVLAALDSAKWNRRRASQELGISYSSLRHKMKKHGLG